MSNPCKESKCFCGVLDMAWNSCVKSLTGPDAKFHFICSISGCKIRVKAISRASTETGSNTHGLKTRPVPKHNHQRDLGVPGMPPPVSRCLQPGLCVLSQADICQPGNKGQRVMLPGRMWDLHQFPLTAHGNKSETAGWTPGEQNGARNVTKTTRREKEKPRLSRIWQSLQLDWESSREITNLNSTQQTEQRRGC